MQGALRATTGLASVACVQAVAMNKGPFTHPCLISGTRGRRVQARSMPIENDADKGKRCQYNNPGRFVIRRVPTNAHDMKNDTLRHVLVVLCRWVWTRRLDAIGRQMIS